MRSTHINHPKLSEAGIFSALDCIRIDSEKMPQLKSESKSERLAFRSTCATEKKVSVMLMVLCMFVSKESCSNSLCAQ